MLPFPLLQLVGARWSSWMLYEPVKFHLKKDWLKADCSLKQINWTVTFVIFFVTFCLKSFHRRMNIYEALAWESLYWKFLRDEIESNWEWHPKRREGCAFCLAFVLPFRSPFWYLKLLKNCWNAHEMLPTALNCF